MREALSEKVIARISALRLFDEEDDFCDELDLRGGVPDFTSIGFVASKVMSAVRSPFADPGGSAGCAHKETPATSVLT